MTKWVPHDAHAHCYKWESLTTPSPWLICSFSTEEKQWFQERKKWCRWWMLFIQNREPEVISYLSENVLWEVIGQKRICQELWSNWKWKLKTIKVEMPFKMLTVRVLDEWKLLKQSKDFVFVCFKDVTNVNIIKCTVTPPHVSIGLSAGTPWILKPLDAQVPYKKRVWQLALQIIGSHIPMDIQSQL